MMTANNAIYTPTPATIRVTLYRGPVTGKTKVTVGHDYLISLRGEIIGHEDARVVSRGNLLSNGVERWFTVELADGSRHSVIGEGS